MPTSTSVGVLGTGSYLPKEEVGNSEIAARFGVGPDWIERKTLIRYRRIASDFEATSDLAIKAGAAALDQAGIGAEDLSYLIVSTGTGDFPSPPTSCLVQSGLRARRAAAFDLNATCSGFVHGLAVARGLLRGARRGYALVIASEVYSRFTDPDNRGTAVLFGDGAGAAVLGPVPAHEGVLDVELHSDGEAHDLIVIPAGGSRRPASAQTVAQREHVVHMKGHQVTDFVLDNVPAVLEGMLARNGLSAADVDHFVPHQANGMMVGALAEQAGLSGAITHMTVQKYGNMGSASVPVTLDHANRSGALRGGDLVLLAGFGSGMTVGSCLLRWCDGMNGGAA